MLLTYMKKNSRFPKQLWLLIGVLVYFTSPKVCGSTICSQVVSDSVTSTIDCTAVPTAQSSETMTPTTLSYPSTAKAVSATTSTVQATPAMTTETSSIYTTTTATSDIPSLTSSVQITKTSVEATTSIATTTSITVMAQETYSMYTATTTTNIAASEASRTQAITTSATTSIEQLPATPTATSSVASTEMVGVALTSTSSTISSAQVSETLATTSTAETTATSILQATSTAAAIVSSSAKSTPISISSSTTTNSTVFQSVGQVSDSISPSSAMSTASPQSSTVTPTLGAQNYDQQIQLKFDGNCSFLSNSTQKAAFEATVRDNCANATGRDPATFKGVNASCGSILVSFTVTVDPNNQGPSVNESITKLKTLIESGSFTITLPDGRNLTANATHFVAVVIIPPTTMPPTTLATTTTTVAPTTKTDGLEPGAIAGIVVGCFVALALICILLYIFCFRKNTVRNPKVDVEYNELKNTSGKTNPGYS